MAKTTVAGWISSLRFGRLAGEFRTLNMSTDITTAAEFHLFNWLDKNRKLLIQAAAVLAVAALVVSFYLWKKGQKEVAAGEALSDISGANAAADYLKLAEEYPNTAAAPHAVLLAAGDLFDNGKYPEAQAQYERLTRDYPDSTLRVAATLGVAACLDAQGKIADAITRYNDFVKRYPSDGATSQARAALGRLYEAQGKPEQALQIYQELARAEANTSFGMEAAMRSQAVLAQHPELRNLKASTAPANVPQP